MGGMGDAVGVERGNWPWRGGDSFLIPDGVTVTLRTGDTSRPWSSGFTSFVNGTRRGLTVAESGQFDWYTTYILPNAEHSAMPYLGGELRMAFDPVTLESAVAWCGPWFELHYGEMRSHPSLKDAVGFLSELRIRDTPIGMQVRPVSTARTLLERPVVHKEIPELGDLCISSPGDRFNTPVWAGRGTPMGELWANPLGAAKHGRARDESLILATADFIIELLPGPDSTPSHEAAVAYMEALDISVSAP